MSLSSHADRRPAFTLIEVMIVVVLLSVAAAVFVPQFQPSGESQLYSAAHVVAADLQYCRNLAVTNASTYRLAFDPGANRYDLSHAGLDPTLDALPRSPFLSPGVGAGGKPIQTMWLGQQPATAGVRLHELTRDGAPAAPQLEFTPLGGLASPGSVEVWLTAGVSDRKRYISIHVHPVTGAVRVGSVSATDASGGGA